MTNLNLLREDHQEVVISNKKNSNIIQIDFVKLGATLLKLDREELDLVKTLCHQTINIIEKII